MIEDPYRWVEAIANRREYIENQLAKGSPIVCMSCNEGVLLLTLSREREKIFEIYDRIAVGAIGHPGDIERLRMAAIESCSAEGYSRSAQDVSLRRLVNYTLSPTLKNAFEQIYGPPFLVRMLFAEVGRAGESDLFVQLDYDGAVVTNGGTFAKEVEPFAVTAGSAKAIERMRRYLREKVTGRLPLEAAEAVALDAWVVGILPADGEGLPGAEAIAARREEVLKQATVEAALLERCPASNIAYRSLKVEFTEPSGAAKGGETAPLLH